MKLMKYGMVALSLMVAGCEDPYYSWIGLEAFDVPVSTLAQITRADGLPITNFSQFISERYGVSAQTMNYIIPSITVETTGSLVQDLDYSGSIEVEAIVTGWETQVVTVINDAQSFSMNLHINGITNSRCHVDGRNGRDLPSCIDIRDRLSEYLDAVKAEVETALMENLSVSILDDSSQLVVSMTPVALSVNCSLDETQVSGFSYYSSSDIELMEAVRCGAEATFHIE